MIPQIAIVGRPNVGKSSLFNWLAGRRIAIVDPTAGVTRDRVSTLVQSGERWFELVDTGGMGIKDADNLTADVERQIEHALDEAAAVLFLVDARAGLTPLDTLVAERLRKIGKPILCVANKCDTPTLELHASDFERFGIGKVIAVSALQHRGKDELLNQLGKLVPPADDGTDQASETPGDVAMKLAIVGRRNTGKSTFINALARSERMIVSEVPGTTRDSVDVRFERDGKVFIAIDTAGVRKKGKVKSDIEFYSLARAERSIRRADVVLLFHDAVLSISQVDKQLAGYVLEQHKPAIFVVNKWDLLAKNLSTGEMADYLRKVYPSLDYVPIAFITAKSGRNVHAVLNLAQNLYKQAGARVSTGDLNRLLQQALADNPPPLRMNRRPKVFFATQVAIHPPTIVLFTNAPGLFDNTYQRYLLKVFRDHLPFHDVPIKLHLRGKRRGEAIPTDGDIRTTPEKKVPKPCKTKALPKGKKRGRAVLWDDV
jgi:GTP-binding protein